MANFYKGDEIKFAINLEAPGFSMDNDDFDIEVASQKVSVKASKGEQASEDTALIIFKETSGDSSSSDETEGTWYAIVDTTSLTVGEMRVIATAFVPDANANDGVRRQSAVAALGTLKNK